MLRLNLISFLLLSLIASQSLAQNPQNPRVVMETDRGPIFLQLDADNAPVTTENFINYVDEGFFDGLIFHRVVDDFVVQGGGFDRNYEYRAPTQPNIVNEGNNGLLNVERTIAMARASALNSANSQFYFNLGANDNLDGGYAVFGEVIGGWATVQEIAGLSTGIQTTPGGNFPDTPMTPPVIQRAYQFSDFPIMSVHSGSWFDPNNGGVGFNIEVTNQGTEDDQPIVNLYWYDFSEGNQIWLVGTAGFDWGDSEVTIGLLGVVTPNETTDFQTPPEGSAFTSRGTITVRFNDCNSGQFSYDLPDFGSGQVDVARLTVPDRIRCDRYQLD
ncbi:peptidylprolyl isomerase [Wenzhouxiangella marina]|uniref:peptidylprolyl isomerase n=1 Tax=Wenzhouxiangella marina TaxID=1579979 RepID=A0A0K0Y002_9GAMM|nr:peptidylprolyl isomerase [Wenzhouxiangella marina]AKS43245.1 peptidylprolyl isomerase [Wenzhouxiangella marina]MBB6087068.1 cyclophilin family peptidyl-prolyl cis-trans isomerase [Wenzhouxiangella marina]